MLSGVRFSFVQWNTSARKVVYDENGCARGNIMRCISACGVCLALCVFSLVLLQGCAVGRDDSTGAIVLGFEAGRLVETGPQALAAAVGSFVPGAAPIVGVITGLLGIGTAAHYRAKRNGERSGWDERGREVVDTPQGPASYVAQRNNGVGSSNQDDGNLRPVSVGGHDSGDAVSVSS